MIKLEAYEEIINSDEFKDWRKKNPETYLAHAFTMLDENNKGSWQIGFYDKKTDRMTSFEKKEKITVTENEEIFKKEERIKELDMSKVKIDCEKAMQTANELQQKEYKQETPFKKIVILQNIKSGLVWNITFVTQSFKTLNIKIDATTNKVVKYVLTSLMDYKTK